MEEKYLYLNTHLIKKILWNLPVIFINHKDTNSYMYLFSKKIMTCLQELHQRGDDSLSLEQLSTFCTVSCQIPQSPGTLILQTELMYMKSSWCPKKYWHNICLFYNKQDTGSNSVLFVDISYRVFTIVIPYWTQRINMRSGLRRFKNLVFIFQNSENN